MRYRMKATANGPDGVFLVNQVYDFAVLGCEELGRTFADAGYAEPVLTAAVEPQGRTAVEPKAESREEPVAEELPAWPLRRYGPQSYLDTYGDDAPQSDLARRYVDAGRPSG